MANTPDAKDHVHPGPSQSELVRLGAVLGVITALEFGIVYLTGMRTMVVLGLYLLSLVKFLYVVRVFMHLKYDHKLLGWIFAFGMLLATSIVNAVFYILRA